jgi:TM2 domain-containing membrane protein YozV
MTKAEQKHGMPALLSFFIPGFGQLIKGHVIKGILIFIGMIISIILIFMIIGIITTPILWIWNIYDAYNSN